MNTDEIRGIFRTAAAFLSGPRNTFLREGKKPLKRSIKHMLTLSVIAALLGSAITYFSAMEYLSGASGSVLSAGGDPVFMTGLFVASYVMINTGLVVASLWLHLWVFIFGGREGIRETMKSVF